MGYEPSDSGISLTNIDLRFRPFRLVAILAKNSSEPILHRIGHLIAQFTECKVNHWYS